MTGREDKKETASSSDEFRFYDRGDPLCWFFNERLKMPLGGIWFVYFIFALVLTAFMAFLKGHLFPIPSNHFKEFFEDWEWIIGHGIFAPIGAVIVAHFCKKLSELTNKLCKCCLVVNEKSEEKLQRYRDKLGCWLMPLLALVGAVAVFLWIYKGLVPQHWNSKEEGIAFWYPRFTVFVNYYLALLLGIKLFYVNVLFLPDIMKDVKLKQNYPDRCAGLGICGKWFMYTATCICWASLYLLDLKTWGNLGTMNPIYSRFFLTCCAVFLSYSLLIIFFPMAAIHKRMQEWKKNTYDLLENDPKKYYEEIWPGKPIPDPITPDVIVEQQNLINKVSEWPIDLRVGIVTQVVLPIVIAWGPWTIDRFILKRPLP